jgi:hypothetical protein
MARLHYKNMTVALLGGPPTASLCCMLVPREELYALTNTTRANCICGTEYDKGQLSLNVRVEMRQYPNLSMAVSESNF